MAFEKDPMKVSQSIHFSSTSHPPRLTPRINAELNLAAGVCVGSERAEVVFVMVVMRLRTLQKGVR